jgi:hypothetical protein
MYCRRTTLFSQPDITTSLERPFDLLTLTETWAGLIFPVAAVTKAW